MVRNNNVYDVDTSGFDSPFVSMQSPCGSLENYARTRLVKEQINVPISLIDDYILNPINKGVTLYIGKMGMLTTKPSLFDFGVVTDITEEYIEVNCKIPREQYKIGHDGQLVRI